MPLSEESFQNPTRPRSHTTSPISRSRRRPSASCRMSSRPIMVEIETDDGLAGWGDGRLSPPDHRQLHQPLRPAPVLIGEDPVLIERINYKLWKQFIFAHRDLGRSLVSGACDDRHRALGHQGAVRGRSVHHLIGGAFDRIDPGLYAHGAAYGGAPVSQRRGTGGRVEASGCARQPLHSKNTVGRQTVPRTRTTTISA